MTEALLLLMMCVSVDSDRVDEALRAHGESTRWQARFAVTVTSEWVRPELGPFRQTVRIRCDGDRVDYAGETLKTDQSDFTGNVTFRAINDGTWFLNRTTPLSRRKLVGGRSARRDALSRRNREASANGFNLDGYFPGNEQKSISELLLEATDRTALEETIDGHPCLTVSAATKYGELRASLDPAAGYALRAARVRKAVGDWNGDGVFGETAETRGLSEWIIDLSDVSVETIGDRDLPVRATVSVTSQSAGKRRDFSYAITRSDFNLNPDFTGTDAFQMDFDDGARVTDFDQPESKIGYIWRQGAMLPEGGQGVPMMGTGGFHNTEAARSRVWMILGVNAVLLAAGATWYVWGRGRSS